MPEIFPSHPSYKLPRLPAGQYVTLLFTAGLEEKTLFQGLFMTSGCENMGTDNEQYILRRVAPPGAPPEFRHVPRNWQEHGGMVVFNLSPNSDYMPDVSIFSQRAQKMLKETSGCWDNREAFIAAYQKRYPTASQTEGKFAIENDEFTDTTVNAAWWAWQANPGMKSTFNWLPLLVEVPPLSVECKQRWRMFARGANDNDGITSDSDSSDSDSDAPK